MVSGVQSHNISTVYCTVCSPAQVKSPSITIYPPLPFSTYPLPPFPLVVTILLSVSMKIIFA